MTEDEHSKELRRWQDAIRDLLLEHVPGADIDGGGGDSGDPLDFTLAEISQGMVFRENQAFDCLFSHKLADQIRKGESATDCLCRLFADLTKQRDEYRAKMLDALPGD